MINTSLITGASGGIGEEMARYHASKGGNIVMVARSIDKLHELKSELESNYNIKVTVIESDLSKADSAMKIFAITESAGIQIDILINNAGFGGHGKFHERDLIKDQAMMQVNMVSLVNLTHLYLQGMVNRNYGKILHVASTAGFLPGPLQAVYYATKGFIVSFSQAIAQELIGSNVTSTVFCPGPVATGFVTAGGLEGVKLWDNATTAKSAAICGYEAMVKGDLLKINEKKLGFVLNWVVPFLPRKILLKISQKAMEKN
ncbi:MAG: SDR family NAD(P)-dependent oxidoreductase [Desulfobacterales bacterium]|nr:SDR family NAD(P)-dependent oxidoreductase [Desulfobacterales bacterium]MCP4162500.1 SDR family NAD(P)-dependent oxidoreductase [Deltaproteobacteria bacterium]